MFIAGNVLKGLAVVINIVLEIYFWVIIARALISWVNPRPLESHCQSSRQCNGTCSLPHTPPPTNQFRNLIFPQSSLFC